MNDERKGCTSASNAQADLLCPGRHLAQQGCPDNDSEDAIFGREIHAALAAGDGSKLTPEQFDIFEACQKIEAKKVGEFFGESKPTVIREQRFWWRCKEPKMEHSGQPDVLYRTGTRALILEYKTLPGELPDSPSNLQLRDQVVLVYGNVPLLSEIGVAIIQPLVTSEPELCLYEKHHIQQAEAEMFARVAASNRADSQRIPGDVQCKYCKAKGLCGPYQKWASSMLPEMSILDVPVASWTPEQRALFCDRRAVAQKWLDECVEAMKTCLQADPASIPGYSLAPGKVRETIIDPQAVFDRFAAVGGKLDNFMRTIAVGKTKLKTELSVVTGQKGKALEETLKKLTQGLVNSKQDAPTLVKIKT